MKTPEWLQSIHAENEQLRAERGVLAASLELALNQQKLDKAEIDRLRFALKCSIVVTDMLLLNIDTMNVVGKRFGIKPLETSPPPAFIKQILEGSRT